MGVAVLVLAVLLLAALLFGVAAVSVGHGSPLSDAEPDRRPPVLAGRGVGAEDVQGLRFTMAMRGYRMDEVDAVLDRLAGELSVRDAELSRLRGEPVAAQDAASVSEAAPVPVSEHASTSEVYGGQLPPAPLDDPVHVDDPAHGDDSAPYDPLGD
jgi:DivIVA domain-containing protein